MDDLDLSMLRAMYPDRAWRVWGTDPRIPVIEVARSVALGRNAARLRLRRWREEGFWCGFDVWPNPGLFGSGVARFELMLSETQNAESVLDEVGTVEGALRAYTGYGDERSPHPGTSVSVLCIDEHTTTARNRRLRHLHRLVAERGVRGPFVMSPPPCRVVPDSLDWRIIAAARRMPDQSVRKLSKALGRPERGVRRRWNALVLGRALWYIPNLDWSKSPSIVLHITCDAPGSRAEVTRAIEAIFPRLLHLEVDQAVYGGRLEPFAKVVAVRVPVESAAAVQQAIARLLAVAHVRKVAPDYPLKARSYPDWFDAKLDLILQSRARTAR